MRILICTVGSIQCEATLRFGAELAKVLSADTTLLGIAAKGQTGEQLRHGLDRTAQDLAGGCRYKSGLQPTVRRRL